MVLLAEQLPAGTRVAIKTLLPGRKLEPEDRDFFLRESALAQSVRHAHAVRVLPARLVGDVFYIVMEYVDGPDLAHYTVEVLRRALSAIEATTVALQILDPLELAHAAGLVHRDVKPNNVLVASPFPSLDLKLADFGMMRSFETFSGMEPSGVGRGTPGFMPPEQLADAKHAGPAADIYGVGATLYWLVSGRPPIDPTIKNWMIATVNHAAPPLRSVAPHVPPAFAAVVMKCVERDATKRWSSIAELRTALRAAMHL